MSKKTKNTGKADPKAKRPIAATGTPKVKAATPAKTNIVPVKVAPVKKEATPADETKTPKVAAEKTAAASKVVPGTIHFRDQSDIISQVRKGWAENEKNWTKKFNLPTSSDVDGQTTLINKIQYGLVSLNDL